MPGDAGDAGRAPTPWLDDDEQHAWRALVLGSELLFGRLNDELERRHGLTFTEYSILVRLSERDGRMRMAQLADALAHSRSRVTHTIKRMEGRRLVRREDSPEDGRGVDAVMTDEGLAVLEKTAPTHVLGVRRHLLDLAGPGEVAALGRVMDAVCDHLIAGHPEMEIREA
ncbi:Multidrug resistance operon repressor [Nocardioides aquaticus]|uniref:Multidrug resistance operon repressor n=1 Tax=Nocardioides aquaticus TaxID=160826 RepID=A0ABX8EKE3_9ACTN|nr:MarR family transcriptional regulator [Nocardioides aquaticus]QVT80999.1 Multidrug resistance operon repressor [Nocardioides aquaticus]